MLSSKLLDRFIVPPEPKHFRLKDYDPGWAQTPELEAFGKKAVKERAQEVLAQNRIDLAAAQELLYASDTHSLLIMFQAMDAAGKDGTIKHVMSGVNPQGVQVYSFKKPSDEELHHDFLWRCAKVLPERGRIGIFNRSYYEDVLVVRVHPELVGGARDKEFWEERYESIRGFEQHLVRNDTVILKFFLHVSKEEQKERFLERLENPKKHWKFNAGDLAERQYWDAYVDAYEKAIAATSTKYAPWHVVPADNKWATRAIVADIITSTIREMDLKYPEVPPEERQALARARAQLRDE